MLNGVIFATLKSLIGSFLGSMGKVLLSGLSSDVFEDVARDLVTWLLRKLAKSTKNSVDDEMVERYIREINEAANGKRSN